MKHVLLIISMLASVAIASSQSLLRADFLLEQMQQTPVAVARNFPWLSWETSPAQSSSAWHIFVATAPALLRKGIADCWERENVRNTGIQYAGKELNEGVKYYWCVEEEATGHRSAVASFVRGGDSISHYDLASEWQRPVRTVSAGTSSTFFDFGTDAFAQLRVVVTSMRSDSVTIEAGELAHEHSVERNAGRNIRYTFIRLAVLPGTHSYNLVWPADQKRNARHPIQMPEETGEVYPFRYVSVTGTPSVSALSVERKNIHYPFNDTASYFVSSDTVLNKVWEMCKYTMKATGFSGFYVDGDRERIPYEADALINQLSHYAVDAEYSMARRTLAYLLFHPTWPTEWSLQDVLSAWNDYMYTGDPSFLRKYYDELYKKMLTPLQDTSGLISTKTGKQTDALLQSVHRTDFDGRHQFVDITDWPQSGAAGNEKQYGGETDGFVFAPYNAVVNAFYYRNLVVMKMIAAVLGRDAEADQLAARAEQVCRSYRRVFINEHGLVKDGDTTLHCSLHANMFALAFGLVPGEDISRVSEFIRSRGMACSVYGAQFLMEALYEAGEDSYALSLLASTAQRSWYNMIRSGATITLEAWDKIYKPNLDMNHAWGAAPANIIVRKLMGLEPVAPGFERMRICPQIGTLTSATLYAPTIRGQVRISFVKSLSGTEYTITIPGSSLADISLPAGKGLLLDGKIYRARIVNGRFEIPAMSPGTYKFTIR